MGVYISRTSHIVSMREFIELFFFLPHHTLYWPPSTARHVVLPCNEVCNEEYRVDSASQAVQPLMLPGDAALGRMKCDAERERGNYTESMELLEKRGRSSARQTGNIKGTLENFRKEIIKLDKLIKDLNEWEPRGSREVGHAVFSPPISTDEDIHWRGESNYWRREREALVVTGRRNIAMIKLML